MYIFLRNTALCTALLASGSNAFVAPSGGTMSHRMAAVSRQVPRQSRMTIYTSPEEAAEMDDEITRLKSMATKLRAEAAALEAEKAQQLADAAEKAFRKFDTDQDGEVNLADLKKGLEKTFKMELSDSRVQELMSAFDTSGDGALQLDEFVGVDKFRNKLEALAREEKELARQAAQEAKKEAEEALLVEARIGFLNDKPPTNTDKLISILPYLFPLLDGLQFGRFLLEGDTNPLVVGIALLYTLYRSIPFGGFISFFALNILSGNPSLNRLVRFNMQQAIYLDIALFFPSLIYSIYNLVFSGLGFQIPSSATELGTDAVFVVLIVTLVYAVISSLLGITPDKVPLISNYVNKRMPTIDMFDDSGRFIGRPRDEEDEKDKNDDK